MMRTWRWAGARVALVGAVCVLAGSSAARGQVDFSVYRSLGDSLTHGTQGGKVVDYRTQEQAYPVLLAEKMNTAFPLNLLTIATGSDEQSVIGAPNYVQSANLAVNGAQLDHALYRGSKPLDPPDYLSDDRPDLVLAGRPTGTTQVSAAVDDGATFTTVWLGGNDFLNTLTKYGTVLHDFLDATLGIPWAPDPLNVTDLTDTVEYASDYAQLMDTLMAVPNMKMAIANFPELKDVAGVLDKTELTALIGPNPMPEDALTSELMAAVLLFDDVNFFGQDIFTPDMLTDPANYWDAAEAATINATIDSFNDTIATQAALHDVALVDIRSLFADISSEGVQVGDWLINDDWFVANLGQKKASLYSSDGVHPSDIGHGLIANAFIDAINSHYGTTLEKYSEAELKEILDNDKFADNDLDGKIEGIDSPGVPYLSLNTFAPDYTGDTVDIAIPEPAGLVLIGLGGLLATRRRR